MKRLLFALLCIIPALSHGQAYSRADNFTLTMYLDSMLNAGVEQLVADSVTRPLNTAFQVSTTRPARVAYTLSITANVTILGDVAGMVYVETSPNGTKWQSPSQFGYGWKAAALGTQTITFTIPQFARKAYWVRIRTDGNATITYINGRETTL